MLVSVLTVVCLLASVGALQVQNADQILTNFYSAIYKNDNQVELSVETIAKSIPGGRDLLQLLKLGSISFPNGKCQLNLKQKHIACSGQFSGFNNKINSAIKLDFVLAKDNKILFALQFQFTHQLNAVVSQLSSDLIPEANWFKSKLTISENEGTSFIMRLATETFSIGSDSNRKGVFLHLSHAKLTANLFALQHFINNLPTQQLEIRVNLPFHSDSYKVNKQQSSFLLNFHQLKPVTLSKTFLLEELHLTVFGFSNEAQVEFSALAHFASVPKTQWQVSVQGRYDGQSKLLTLEGETKETKPFLKWLKLKYAKVAMQLQLLDGGKVHCDSVDFDGVAVITTHKNNRIEPRLIGKLTDNAKNFFFELDVSHRQMDLLETVLMKDKLVLADAMQISSSSVTLVVTNLESSTSSKGKSCTTGINFFSEIQIKQQTQFAKMLSPIGIQEKIETMRLGLTVQAEMDFASSSVSKVHTFVHLDNVVFNKHVVLTTTQLSFNILLPKLESISLISVLTWTPQHKSAFIFAIKSSWTSSTQLVKFEGGLQDPVNWDDWLTIKQAKLSFTVSTGGAPVLKTFGIEAAAKFSWTDQPTQDYSVKLYAIENFSGVFFQAKALIVSDGGKKLLQSSLVPRVNDAKAVHDLSFQKAEINLVISTSLYRFEGSYYEEGVSLEAIVQVKQQSSLRKQLVAFYQHEQNLDFSLHLHVPFNIVNGVKFSLKSPRIQVKDNIIMEKIEMSVTAGATFKLYIAGGMSVKFDSQANWILFAISGEVTSQGQITIGGGMQGTWSNAVGIPGLNLHKAYLQLGFITVPPYLSAFGVGCNISMGETAVSLDGYANLLNPVDVYFKSEVDNLGLGELVDSLQDLSHFESMDAGAFQRFIYSLKHPKPHLSRQENVIYVDVPSNGSAAGERRVVTTTTQVEKTYFLLIKDLDIHFAPNDKLLKIGAIEVAFKKGMSIYGHIQVLGLKDSRFYLRTIMQNGRPNFQMELDINFTTLYEKWMAFMKILFPNKEFQQPIEMNEVGPENLNDFIKKLSEIIPQITNLKIANFDLNGLISGNIKPQISVTILFRKKEYTFGSKISFQQLARPVSVLFEDNIIDWKQVLGLPQCLSNVDCRNGQKCFHERGHSNDKKCVDHCGDLGEIPLFGCSRCITSAECTRSGRGSCCRNGRCEAAKNNGQFCGMCGFGRRCNSPASGCIFTFCTKCITSLDCKWKGSAGGSCRNGRCQ